MATEVRISCRTCTSRLELDITDVELIICTDTPGLNCYSFPCSGCGCRRWHTAEREAVVSLEAGGAHVIRWSTCENTLTNGDLEVLREFTTDLPSILDAILRPAS